MYEQHAQYGRALIHGKHWGEEHSCCFPPALVVPLPVSPFTEKSPQRSTKHLSLPQPKDTSKVPVYNSRLSDTPTSAHNGGEETNSRWHSSCPQPGTYRVDKAKLLSPLLLPPCPNVKIKGSEDSHLRFSSLGSAVFPTIPPFGKGAQTLALRGKEAALHTPLFPIPVPPALYPPAELAWVTGMRLWQPQAPWSRAVGSSPASGRPQQPSCFCPAKEGNCSSPSAV